MCSRAAGERIRGLRELREFVLGVFGVDLGVGELWQCSGCAGSVGARCVGSRERLCQMECRRIIGLLRVVWSLENGDARANVG